MTSEDQSRLARWSARKLANAEAGPSETPQASGAEPRASTDADQAEAAPMLTEADLPDIDSLTSGSDFRAFLASNVPDHLHKLALRKLWRSDPVLANLDGLNDYDLDYTMSEAMQVARESAMDLARGVKRMNAADRRAQEREAIRQRHAEATRPRPPQAQRADAGPEAAVDAGAEPPAAGDEPA